MESENRLETIVPPPAGASCGAYGLRVFGLPAASELLPLPPGDWPSVALSWRDAVGPSRGTGVTSSAAVIEFVDDEWATLARDSRAATLFIRSPADDGRLVHPFLTSVAVVLAWWDDRVALHGGAFVVGPGAWGLLGERQAGKSTMLACLARRDLPIVADDLLVVRDSLVYSGPRCIDLRAGTSEALGLEKVVGSVRGGERLRLPQRAVAAAVPLRGWFSLAWSDRVAFRSLGPAERLRRLVSHSCTPYAEPGRLMELVDLPAWEFSRPRNWGSSKAAVEALIDLTTSLG